MQATTIGVHLVGHMDAGAAEAMAAQLVDLAGDRDRRLIIYTEQLRLRNFTGFRAMAWHIQNLLCLGTDVRISVSNPQLRAVLRDLDLDGIVLYEHVRADGHVVVADTTHGLLQAG